MTMSRLFTFGCSFTKYHYPTWADIIGSGFDIYQNWARPSAGNNFILASLQECNIRNKLNKDDTVIILFAPLARTDYYRFNTWAHETDTVHRLRSDDIFSCPYGLTVVNYAWVSNIIDSLLNIQVNYELFTWSPFIKNEVYDLYKNRLDQITNTKFDKTGVYPYACTVSEEIKRFYITNVGPNWPSLNDLLNGNFFIEDKATYNEIVSFRREVLQMQKTPKYDGHPSPVSHLHWVKKYLPNYTIKQEIIDLVNKIDSKIINKEYYEFVSNEPLRF